MRACGADGSLDISKFGKPLPTIGLYVAGASLCCAAAMALDTFRGFRSRRLWFPSRYFTLNAATLTVLAVATKLPVDLNTSMPRPIEQLSKLSGTVLICTVMGNFMPSLGDTDNAASNIVALGILVATAMVNVGIQMGTGVIYVHLWEHAIVIFFMLVLLILLISSAVTVSTTKRYLEKLYDAKHQKLEGAGDDGSNGTVDEYDHKSLKERVKKYWLMAHTSSPQYVLGRSATCTASGAFCLLSALLLVEATVRSFAVERSHFCSGTSDYRWSIIVVSISQALAILVGTIAPAFRWFTAVRFRSPEPGNWSRSEEFRVESYWVEKLTQWKEAPLRLPFRNRRCREITHNMKNLILNLLIEAQMGVVLASKLVRLLSIFPVWWLDHGTRPFRKLDSTPSSVTGPNLEEFVLHLEGEKDLVKLITRSERKDTDRWIKKAGKKNPRHLYSLIRDHSTRKRNPPFIWVGRFDSNGVAHQLIPEGSEPPPHCWALPVVTLASIAVALPGVDDHSLKSLLRAVGEGLRYVRKIEKNLEAKGLLNQRKAADIIWSRVSLHSRWLGWDLRRLGPDQPESSRKVIEELEKIAKACMLQFREKGGVGLDTTNSLEWPPKVLAAYCMYTVTTTILLHCDMDPRWEGHLFGCCLRKAISDLLGACLTNLPRAISMECFCNAIEVREENVRGAAFLLGEAEEIMSLLANAGESSSYPCKKARAYVDGWREKIGSSSKWSFDDEVPCSTHLASISSETMSSTLSSSHTSSFTTTDGSVRSVETTTEGEPCPPEEMV